MEKVYKILILVYLLVPFFAYLDAVIIRGTSFEDYLYICLYEIFIYSIGVLTGLKLFKKS